MEQHCNLKVLNCMVSSGKHYLLSYDYLLRSAKWKRAVLKEKHVTKLRKIQRSSFLNFTPYCSLCVMLSSCSVFSPRDHLFMFCNSWVWVPQLSSHSVLEKIQIYRKCWKTVGSLKVLRTNKGICITAFQKKEEEDQPGNMTDSVK